MSKTGPKTFIFFHSPVFWDFPLTYYKETAKKLSTYCSVLYFASDEPVLGYRDILDLKKRNHFICSLQSYFEPCTFFVPFNILPGNRYSLIHKTNKSIHTFILKLLLYVKSINRRTYHYMTHPDMLDSQHLFNLTHIIYDCMEYPYSHRSKGENVKTFERHKHVCRVAKIVFVNSTSIKNICTPYSKKVIQIPAGFNLKKFIRYKSIKKSDSHLLKISKPWICFVGYTFVRMNMELLYAVTKQNPKLSFIFVGPEQTDVISYSNTSMSKVASFTNKWAAYKKLTNVYHLDKKDFHDVASIINMSDVCIIPYDTKLIPALYANAIKAYEYLAMGKNIVSTTLLPLMDMKTHILFADRPDTFSKAINRSLRRPTHKSINAKKQIAAYHDIDNKARLIMQALAGLHMSG